MKNTKDILPTANEVWGLWGSCEGNGLPQAATWEACSRFFIERYNLSALDTRNLLDSKFGRHLADRLSYGNTLEEIFAIRSWEKWVRLSIREAQENRSAFPAA